MKIQLPYSSGIELVEGCNRLCSFCGLTSMWKDPSHRIIKFMDINLAKELAIDYGKWFIKKRIDFAEHGEPTLHPELFPIIATFRYHNPTVQLQLTTNGILIRKYGVGFIKEIFKSGLNILLIDTYTNRKEIEDIVNYSGYPVSDYYDPLNKVNPYGYNSNKIQTIVLMGDIEQYNKKRTTRKIHNNAGNTYKTNLSDLGIVIEPLPLVKKCSRPFRELVVHNDGTVPICCYDFRHEFIINKFPDFSLQEIWNSSIFNIARSVLFSKNRTFAPCYKCNFNGGFRIGLIRWDRALKSSDIETLKDHKLLMSKYRHPSVIDPLWIENKNIGISKFIKGEK